MKRLFALPLLCLLAAGPARAACHLTITPANISASWTTSYVSQSVTFTLKDNSGGSCSYIIGFSAGGAAGTNFSSRRAKNGTATLNYQLFGDASLTHILKDKGSFSVSSDALTGSINQGQTLTLTYYFQIPVMSQPTNTLPASGTFTDAFTISAYTGSLSNPGNANTSASVNVSVNVPKVIDISLVGSGGSFTTGAYNYAMAFGTVTSSQTLAMSMLVRANAGYSITFSSGNNGVMKAPGLATTLPYTLKVGTTTENLLSSATSPVQVATGTNQTTVAGVSNTVSVTSGSPNASLAGSYSDNIMITATSTQ